MSTSNTTSGYFNIPKALVGVSTEVACLVPASGYAGFPSPTMPASSGLSVGLFGDIAGNMTYDGHPFNVRVTGLVKTAGAYNVTLKLYQVPQSGVGVISATGSVTTAGAPGSGDNVVISLAATSVSTATVNFLIDATFQWDATSKHLNGYMNAAQIDGVNIAVNSGTAGTGVATTQVTSVGINDLSFLPSITFGTANAANAWWISELAIDRD